MLKLPNFIGIYSTKLFTSCQYSIVLQLLHKINALVLIYIATKMH